MKQILIACLLGIGTLLPSNEVKSSVIYYARIVDIHISGWVLSANSQTEDGTISKMEVYLLSTGELMQTQGCNDYNCSMNLSSLHHGNYSVKITCQYTTVTKQFVL